MFIYNYDTITVPMCFYLILFIISIYWRTIQKTKLLTDYYELLLSTYCLVWTRMDLNFPNLNLVHPVECHYLRILPVLGNTFEQYVLYYFWYFFYNLIIFFFILFFIIKQILWHNSHKKIYTKQIITR